MPPSKLRKLKQAARQASDKAIEAARQRAERKKQRAKRIDRQEANRLINRAGRSIEIPEARGRRRRRPPEETPSERAAEQARMAPPVQVGFNPLTSPEDVHKLAGGDGLRQPLRDPQGRRRRSRRGREPMDPMGDLGVDEMALGVGATGRESDDDQSVLDVEEDVLTFGGDDRGQAMVTPIVPTIVTIVVPVSLYLAYVAFGMGVAVTATLIWVMVGLISIASVIGPRGFR